ncbi:hypothetical protein QFC24_005501 [Naganishia onofrii]|uniref:Uncharacterized protein n=1 Tax=Naganishia onofrii TaxID=1851511 RepID=A0ACC2X8U8_9TREE|nr:hypothetical protein QFC24_005501 [Naganishia onofrii]
MLPRFLKTFLFVLVLIVVPTLVLLYRNHATGSNWNEWSLDTGTSDSSWRSLSTGDIDGDDDGLSPLHLEDHWNAGGAEPDYRHAKVVEAERETESTGESNTRTVYRLGDTLVNQEELEAFRIWRQTDVDGKTTANDLEEDDLTRKDDGDDELKVASAWSSNAAVQGGVIMPKLGNATAKYALIPFPMYHTLVPSS